MCVTEQTTRHAAHIVPAEMLTSLSPEFRLVVACCVWPTTERRIAAINAATTVEVNWETLLRVVKRHRVPGLVFEGLVAANVSLPPPILARLKASAQASLRQNFNFLVEAHRLQDLLVGAAIPVAFVKGVCLAMRVFASLAVRQSKDIDLLVRPQDVQDACAILGRAGYQRIRPPPLMAGDRLADWCRFNNQTEWVHRHSQLHVELHWHLTHLKGMMREPLALHVDFQEVRFSPTVALRTITDEKLFIYLCVHGAGHAWTRLKWLADVGALLAEMTGGVIERIYRAARCGGEGRAVAQALMLCERLFGTPIPRDLSDELRGDIIQRSLVWCAVRAMTRGGAQVEFYDLLLGSTFITLSNFLLLPKWRFVVAELLAKSVNPDDLVEVPLPRSLHLLYPLLRLPLWLRRRARRVTRSLRFR